MTDVAALDAMAQQFARDGRMNLEVERLRGGHGDRFAEAGLGVQNESARHVNDDRLLSCRWRL